MRKRPCLLFACIFLTGIVFQRYNWKILYIIPVFVFMIEVKNAQKFISDGNRVKVSVRFRGREMAHTEIGRGILDRFAEACAETAVLDKPCKMEGRSMVMFLAPKNNK